MFKKLIDNLGYIPKKELTEEKLSYMLSELLQFDDDMVLEIESKALFKELKNVEGFIEYLKVTSNQDMRRYFGAVTKEEQLQIRGAFARTNYIKARVINEGEEKKPELKSKRYG